MTRRDGANDAIDPFSRETGLSSAILSQKAVSSSFSVLSPTGGAPMASHRPVIWLAVRDEGSDADDRVVDVLRKFFADGLANLNVGLADKVVGGCEPAEVGHGLQVPDDDARFHADRV